MCESNMTKLVFFFFNNIYLTYILVAKINYYHLDLFDRNYCNHSIDNTKTKATFAKLTLTAI